jgi:hypothetical protein
LRNHKHHNHFNSLATLPNVPANYNRVNAWTDEQWLKQHPTEWTDETDKITYGAYDALMQQSTPDVPDNYNRVNAWTDP